MLSTTTKYALCALTYIYKDKSEGFISFDVLYENVTAPRSYLAKLMKILASKDLVISKKGLHGGFMQNIKKANISFYDVCIALDDPITRESCILGKHPCGKGGFCSLHSEWNQSRIQIGEFLKKHIIAS